MVTRIDTHMNLLDLSPEELKALIDGTIQSDKPKGKFRLKGGPGSGNFAHRGRPGLVGGSVVVGTPDPVDAMRNADWKQRPDFDYHPGISTSYIVELSGDGLAIVKPVSNANDSSFDYRTVHADADVYDICRELGWDGFTPPSVSIEYNRKVAKNEGDMDTAAGVQKWEEGTVAVRYIGSKVNATSVDFESFQKMAFLDVAIGNDDRHEGNFLIKEIDDVAKVVIIDHNLAFNTYTGTDYFRRDMMNYVNMLSNVDMQLHRTTGAFAPAPEHILSRSLFNQVDNLFNDDANPVMRRLKTHYGGEFIRASRERLKRLKFDLDHPARGDSYRFEDPIGGIP